MDEQVYVYAAQCIACLLPISLCVDRCGLMRDGGRFRALCPGSSVCDLHFIQTSHLHPEGKERWGGGGGALGYELWANLIIFTWMCEYEIGTFLREPFPIPSLPFFHPLPVDSLLTIPFPSVPFLQSPFPSPSFLPSSFPSPPF